MKIFYDKHYKSKYSLIVEFIVKLGINLKLLLAKIKFKKGKR